MSGLSSGSSSSIPGTNVPPVSFPGIVSGIDYSSIIQKLTSLTLAPVTQINAQISTLNAANAELLKINAMLASVQNALTALSDQSLYESYAGISSNTSIATATGIPSVAATPGTYVVDSAELATATQVTSAANMGQTENASIGGTVAANVPLIDSYAAITPSNGSSGQGVITVDGVQIKYDVTSQSLDTILGNINTAVHTAGDATFNIGLVGAGDTVQVTDSGHPIALGSSSDSGNLLQVLRLDQAQVQNTGSSGTVTATAGVGGINASLSFNSTNAEGQATNANFVTPVTAGFFTINGVQINVTSSQNVYDVIGAINASAAGVIASYNSATGSITLTNKNTGPQNIVLGSGSDTSNFLQAAGLTTASGATTSLGTQAQVTFQAQGGVPQTVYSNSNSVTDAIPGISLNLQSSDPSTAFTVTVSQSSTQLVTAINAFVSAYNAAISEINKATAPPIVVQSPTGGANHLAVGWRRRTLQQFGRFDHQKRTGLDGLESVRQPGFTVQLARFNWTSARQLVPAAAGEQPERFQRRQQPGFHADGRRDRRPASAREHRDAASGIGRRSHCRTEPVQRFARIRQQHRHVPDRSDRRFNDYVNRALRHRAGAITAARV